MAWVTKDSTESYRDQKEPEKVYSKKEKAANWWLYHKWIVLGSVIGVIAIVWIVKDTVFQTRPDYQVAYVGITNLPDDATQALTTALEDFCDDKNGDGQVVVQLNQYTVDFDSGNDATDAYNQMAGVTKLSADLSNNNSSYIFLLQDPEGFENQTGALQYLDATLPDYDDEAETHSMDWQKMVYRWTDCPVLMGLDLGSFTGYTALDDAQGSNQEVLKNLYIGYRGLWNDKFSEGYDSNSFLWQALTAGATSTAQ